MIKKNKEFRNKTLRGSKIDDLYIFLELLKGKENKEVIESIQNYICVEIGYKPNI